MPEDPKPPTKTVVPGLKQADADGSMGSMPQQSGYSGNYNNTGPSPFDPNWQRASAAGAKVYSPGDVEPTDRAFRRVVSEADKQRVMDQAKRIDDEAATIKKAVRQAAHGRIRFWFGDNEAHLSDLFKASGIELTSEWLAKRILDQFEQSGDPRYAPVYNFTPSGIFLTCYVLGLKLEIGYKDALYVRRVNDKLSFKKEPDEKLLEFTLKSHGPESGNLDSARHQEVYTPPIGGVILEEDGNTKEKPKKRGPGRPRLREPRFPNLPTDHQKNRPKDKVQAWVEPKVARMLDAWREHTGVDKGALISGALLLAFRHAGEEIPEDLQYLIEAFDRKI